MCFWPSHIHIFFYIDANSHIQEHLVVQRIFFFCFSQQIIAETVVYKSKFTSYLYKGSSGKAQQLNKTDYLLSLNKNFQIV